MLPSTLLFLFGFVFLIELYDMNDCEYKPLLVNEDTRMLIFTHEYDVRITKKLYFIKTAFNNIRYYVYLLSVNSDDCFLQKTKPVFKYNSATGRGNVSERIYMYCSNESVSVTIEHPTSADNGMYVLGNASMRLIYDKLMCWNVFVMNIEMRSKWQILAEGSSAHFYGNPVASDENQVLNLSVTWLLDGYTRNQTNRFLAEDEHMWIPSVTRDLDGKSVIYRVQYEDVVGEVYYNLSVIYIEKDTEHEFVEEGSSVSFQVNGFVTKRNKGEAITYSWMLDGRFIHENYKDRMWLPYVTRDLNRKNLTCVIWNENSTVAELNHIIQVAYGPSWPVKLIPPNTAYYLALGDSVPEIRCEVDCNPSCNINWGDFGDGDTLRLEQVSKTNTGEYICTATRNGSDRVVYWSVYIQVSDESVKALAFLPLVIPVVLNTIAIVIIVVCLWRFSKVLNHKALKARDTLNMNASNLRATEPKEHQTVPVPTEMYEGLQKGAQGFDETAYYSSLEHGNNG